MNENRSRIYNEIYRAGTLARGTLISWCRGAPRGRTRLGGIPREREKCSWGLCARTGGPPWGPIESPIVGDLLRRIMPPDEPVNLSVGRSRAASMRRSIIPKLCDIHATAGTRSTGGYYDRAASSGYVNQDQIILCFAVDFSLFLPRMQGVSTPRPEAAYAFESIWVRLRATTGSTYPRTLRGPGRAYTTISDSTRFDVGFKWQERSIYITLAMIIAELRTFNAR